MDQEGCNEDDYPPELLNSKPVEPSQSDCCGSGCSLCIFDVYEQEMKIWRKECRQYFQKENSTLNKEQVISTEEYTKFCLKKITPETLNSNIYQFNIPNNQMLGVNIGQHLILRGNINGKPVTRQYTPISSEDAEGYFDILIKLYEHGKMSKFVRSWKIGMMIDWRGPFGEFKYEPNSFQQIIMMVGGTGITPVVRIIRHILSDEKDETFLRLLFACCNYDEILMKSELETWKSYWNFSVLYCLSQEREKTKRKYGDEIYYGRINQDLICEEIKFRTNNILVIICGSVSFNKDICQFVENLRITNYFIF